MNRKETDHSAFDRKIRNCECESNRVVIIIWNVMNAIDEIRTPNESQTLTRANRNIQTNNKVMKRLQ